MKIVTTLLQESQRNLAGVIMMSSIPGRMKGEEDMKFIKSIPRSKIKKGSRIPLNEFTDFILVWRKDTLDIYKQIR